MKPLPAEALYRQLLSSLGEDLGRQGLVQTPARAAKALAYLTRGYEQTLPEIINDALFDSTMDELIVIKNIELYSLCEHHMLPFFGKCHVGYLPQGQIIGLSKIARIVDYFARRLQVQEVLTQQIADCLKQTLKAKGVGVIIEAQHLCMMMRGVQKQNASMTTSVMLGSLRANTNTRLEFLNLVK